VAIRATLAAAMLFLAPAANATTIVFNFDDLVPEYPSYPIPVNYGGAKWLGFELFAGYGVTSQPYFAAAVFNSSIFEYSAGFKSFSFNAGTFDDNVVISVFDGLAGTGALLGALPLSTSAFDANAFGAGSVAFTGIGRSVVVSNGGGLAFGWDDITITSGVPEPASWAMLIAGFGLVGASARRLRTAA
jgi:hypothetical protein